MANADSTTTTTTTTTTNKRPRVDSDLDTISESPETKRFRENLLDILDDEDAAGDRLPATQELATFMKSFEEEVGLSTSALDSVESQADLGFLLGASDDELGLPPTKSGEDKDDKLSGGVCGTPENAGFDQMWGFDEEFNYYDALGFELRSGGGEERTVEDECVVFGGLFDFSDVGSDVSSEFLWRPESLPAV